MRRERPGRRLRARGAEGPADRWCVADLHEGGSREQGVKPFGRWPVLSRALSRASDDVTSRRQTLPPRVGRRGRGAGLVGAGRRGSGPCRPRGRRGVRRQRQFSRRRSRFRGQGELTGGGVKSPSLYTGSVGGTPCTPAVSENRPQTS